MRKISRRTLLSATASIAVTAGLKSTPCFSQTVSANEQLRVAVIGTGGRGGEHIQSLLQIPEVRIVAVCDADEQHAESSAGMIEKKSGGKVKRYLDYRKLLENDDIDAVTIASPNHWHALMTIHACQAGKHVYVEKPVCHHIWEGRKMVEAMQKYDRIVAAGFQNRSDTGLLQAVPLIHDGTYGAVKQVRGLCYRDRGSIGKRDTPLSPPTSVDYDLWLGPAADLPIMRPKLHYDWHWDFNTGNGDMGNQGPHEMDIVRWALGDPDHPKRIQSFGGRFAWDDAGDTPNLQCALFDFGNDIPVIFEVRNLHQEKNSSVGRYKDGPGVGMIVTCEDAEFRGGRGGGTFHDKDGKIIRRCKGDGGSTHMQNFVDAVRNSDSASLRAPLESSFKSSCMSHLANISVLTGKQASGEELAADLVSNELASECFQRFEQQLDLWSVDTKKSRWTLGPQLSFDAASETFTAGGAFDRANDLIRREPRQAHFVPEQV